jgi:16S rRNA (guanine1516-N2)-methyltransferase
MTSAEAERARVRVEALLPAFAAEAAAWATRLHLPLEGDAELALQMGPLGLQLAELGPDAPGPIRAEFVEGTMAHRRQFGGGNGQTVAKAVGLQSGARPTLVDATAGLGRDAFELARLGCTVTLIERVPVIAALLEDGLRRAREDAELGPIAEPIRLLGGDAIELLRTWPDEPPEVIYLDPMFPLREKSALVKKEMRVFRAVAGDDDDAPALLAAALALATHRVVVKRMRKAPAIEGAKPGYALEGKTSRFDVYSKRSLRLK